MGGPRLVPSLLYLSGFYSLLPQQPRTDDVGSQTFLLSSISVCQLDQNIQDFLLPTGVCRLAQQAYQPPLAIQK